MLALALISAGCRAAGPSEPGPTPIPASPPPPAAVAAAVSPTPLPAVPTLPGVAPSPALTVAPALSSPQADTSPSPLQRLRIVNTGGAGANLRAEPSAQAERIKTLNDGVLVDLVDPGRDVNGVAWRQVRDESGAIGWVSAEFLAPLTAVQIRVSPIPGGNAPGAPTEAAGSSAFATPATRAVPVDKQNCPETHPIKAVGSSGFFYYTPENPRYTGVAPDVCFTSPQVAEALGFRAP